MRDARRTALGIAAALLLGTAPLRAQTPENGLSVESVDPQGDSVFLRRIRQRLDAVRSGQRRPVVALVLSGGGAKGAAEVGAIKYIEELGIPIDFVCGTSIGGLIGGFYALGYDADEIMEIIRAQDWSVMLTDRIAPGYIPYRDKMDRATYLFTIPFYTPAGAKASGAPDRGSRQRIPDAIRSQSAAASLSGSLPSGYAYGFNVDNLLSSLAVGYQDSLSFSRLPIPFACVAGDIASGDAKYWGSGDLVTAMRSTMSVPGLFDPVRVGRLVLVDGGVRNNFPTDIARAVGADYVIGIELSDAAPDYDEIRNLGNVLGRFIPMLGKDAFRRNVAQSDVFIKPSLPEFNMMSFNLEAFDTMYARGYAAADAQRDALLAIRDRTGRTARLPHAKATDISRRPVRLASIEYEGLDEATALRMARLTGLSAEEPLDKAHIDEAMSRLQATAAFETVSYSLYGEQEPYRLVFHCTPAPVHDFGLGLRVDTEEGAALLFRLGFFTNRLSGSKLDLTARIGQNLRGTLHYALDLGELPTLNFTASAARYRGRLDPARNADYRSHREEFFVSGLDWTRFDLQGGLAYKGYRLDAGTGLPDPAECPDLALQAGYLGAFLSGKLYTLDNHYFPTRGVSLDLRADYDFVRAGADKFAPVLSGRLDLRAALPLAGRFTFLPDLRLRSISHFGGHAREDLLHTNFVGGRLAGRYFEDQLPFFAYSRTVIAGDYLVDASAAVRFNPAGRFFVSAMAGVLYDSDTVRGLFSTLRPGGWGLGLEAAYDTIGGPIRLGLHWSDRQGWGAFLTLGFDF